MTLKIECIQATCRQYRRGAGEIFSWRRSANQIRVWIVALFFGVTLFQTTQILFGAEPSIESVLKKYEDGLSTIHSVRMHSLIESSASPEQVTFAFQNGNSLFQKTSVDQNTEMLCQEHVIITAIELFDENKQRDYKVFVDEVPLDSPEDQDVALRSSCFFSACLFGKLQYSLFGTKSIAEVLRRCEPTMTEIDVDGKKMFEIKGKKDGIAISAIFILNNYATLYSFRYDVDEKAEVGGSFVSFDYCPADFIEHGDLLLPRTYQFNYSKLVIAYGYDSDMRLIPKEMEKSSTMLYREKIESIEINPTIPQSFFRISLAIPNGTPVTDRRSRQIEYIWYNGKIEPKTNELMMAIAVGDHKFVPGLDEIRFWMMATGILMILVALGKMLYDAIWRSKRRG